MYLLQFSVFDGYPSTEKWCRPCEKAREKFAEEHRYHPSADSMTEYLDECADESDGAKRAKWRRLAAEIRRRRDEVAQAKLAALGLRAGAP